MSVEKNYVDSHGQSDVAFAFCHLLGFDLLPRLKGISKKKLYRVEAGRPGDFPNLQPILTRPINWDLIAKQYDEMVMIQNVLAEEEWMARMAKEDFRALSPLIHNHVTPYGSFELDMAKRLPLDAPDGRS